MPILPDPPGDGCRTDPRPSVLLLYFGRRGAIVRFTQEVAQTLPDLPDVRAALMVSRQAEGGYRADPTALIEVDTFARNAGALLSAWRIPLIRRRLRDEIAARNVSAVIELMPHVWSAAICPVIRASGARYVVMAHDVESHPGDGTALASHFADRALPMADRVLTMSQTVAERLRSITQIAPERIATLFHPDFAYAPSTQRRRAEGRPLRLLFLGRIMPYKGLPLFADALDLLRREGVSVEVGVFGEGDLGAAGDRLRAHGAEIVNRWLTDDEITAAMRSYDVMVLSHIEASQSGLVAAAYGAAMPVVATPVGGLPEQVLHEVTGLMAASVNADALAGAIKRLAQDPQLYAELSAGIIARREARSMRRFLQASIDAALS